LPTPYVDFDQKYGLVYMADKLKIVLFGVLKYDIDYMLSGLF